MSATWPARASSCRSKLNAAFSFINPCSVLTQLINLLPAAHFFLGLEFDIYWRKMPVVSWDFCYFTSAVYLFRERYFVTPFSMIMYFILVYHAMKGSFTGPKWTKTQKKQPECTYFYMQHNILPANICLCVYA